MIRASELQDTSERKRLRAALKWALRPATRRTESNGVVKDWFARKCEGLVACGFAKHDPIAWQCARLHYVDNRPVEVIAAHFGLSTGQIGRNLNDALDAVLNAAPKSVLVALSPATFEWRLEACPNCKGDQYWDGQGATTNNGEWVCLLCAMREKTC